MAEPKKKGFGELINITSDAFGASTSEPEIPYDEGAPKMVNNRQSVYRVPLSMNCARTSILKNQVGWRLCAAG